MDNQEPQVTNKQKSEQNGNRLALFGLILVIIAVVGLVFIVIAEHNQRHRNYLANTTSSITPAKVSIGSNGFVPQVVSIKVNQAVTWTNNDRSVHEIASDPYPADNTLASLKSASPILAGSSYSYVFKKAGTYYYHDNLNPYTFKGTVIVK